MRSPVIEIDRETIQWPPQCVNCGQRPAAATVRVKGRHLLSGDLDVPCCTLCAAARRETTVRTLQFVVVALAPVIFGGPFGLQFAWNHRDDADSVPLVLFMAGAIVVWMAACTLTLYVVLRRRSKSLGQSAILSPVVVYRSYHSVLPGPPHYRLRIRNARVHEYVVEHNRSSALPPS